MQINDVIDIEAELINRGFSAIHNPRPVYFVLIDTDWRVYRFLAKDADPAKWQPFQPDGKDYKPLKHKFVIKSKLPDGIKPGWYQIGLWLPDAYESISMDSRYAVRLANRDVAWWVDPDGKYGINIIGMTDIVK